MFDLSIYVRISLNIALNICFAANWLVQIVSLTPINSRICPMCNETPDLGQDYLIN